MNSVFGSVTLRPKMHSPSESVAAQFVWATRLCAIKLSRSISRVFRRGRFPTVWSAPWALAIMATPVASTTRGSYALIVCFLMTGTRATL